MFARCNPHKQKLFEEFNTFLKVKEGPQIKKLKNQCFKVNIGMSAFLKRWRPTIEFESFLSNVTFPILIGFGSVRNGIYVQILLTNVTCSTSNMTTNSVSPELKIALIWQKEQHSLTTYFSP